MEDVEVLAVAVETGERVKSDSGKLSVDKCSRPIDTVGERAPAFHIIGGQRRDDSLNAPFIDFKRLCAQT